jgi:glycosyltransferase involved in cell wall biosynthesis
VLKEALSLKHAGYQPQVIALHENNLAEEEIVQSIPVRRIRLPSRGWPRILPVQAFKYLEWLWRAFFLARQSDILHCNDLQTLPVGAMARILSRKRSRVVYDAHELEINDVANESRWMIRIKQIMERILIRHADATITVSESIAAEYSRMYGIEKPALVLNCPPLTPLPHADIFREKLSIPRDSIIFLYQGGLAPGRGIESLMAAFRDLPDRKRVVVFMGYGPLADAIKQAASQYPNIFYYAAVSPAVLPAYTASADVGLCLIENLCLSYYYCLPNKLFEYLMAGLPVLVSDLQELRRFVQEHPVGQIVAGGNVQSIQKAVMQLDSTTIEAYGKDVLATRLIFHWAAQEKTLLTVYSRVSGF